MQSDHKFKQNLVYKKRTITEFQIQIVMKIINKVNYHQHNTNKRCKNITTFFTLQFQKPIKCNFHTKMSVRQLLIKKST